MNLSNKQRCKYAIGASFILLCIFLLQNNLNTYTFIEADMHLPGPVIDFSTANKLISYKMKAMDGDTPSLTVIIRTYEKFIERNATAKLLQNFNSQKLNTNTKISAIIVSTDANSIVPLKKAVGIDVQSVSNSNWKRQFHNIDINYHDIPYFIYNDNAFQFNEICKGKYKDVWIEAGNRYYNTYKSKQSKIDTSCKGNNMLHYILTDVAVNYVKNSCGGIGNSETYSDSDIDNCNLEKYVLVTNGDNEYKLDFVQKVIDKMNNDHTLDALMVNYLERGINQVISHTSGNNMDLGCMIFRIKSLKKFHSTFITSLTSRKNKNSDSDSDRNKNGKLVNIWPYHYYGADREFMMYLYQHKNANIGYLKEDLFIHW
jgi:hypothetical protein